eukprot:TRINITY_DN10361_c0_g1_i1.p1 TRINITY_DN10361_c0_g1~~TRINITY_DN10361_c0_g1_i1.p1  ORF type:complete len:453 (+),score=84.86 TRINITY_DN10361_c0_g1_i1:114-1472(+)
MSAVDNTTISAGVQAKPLVVFRYSREALMSLNVKNKDEKQKEAILKCLKPFHIDKGNMESIVKTDTNVITALAAIKTPDPKAKPVIAAPQTVPNMPTHRPLAASPPVSPVTLHAIARTPLAALNNKVPQAALAPKALAPKALPKALPAQTPAKDKVSLKENENTQKKAPKETPSKAAASAQKAFVTPSKKVYVAKPAATPSVAVSSPTPAKAAAVLSPVKANTPATTTAIGQAPSCVSSPGSPLSKEPGVEESPEEETDPHRLQQRQKQIDYGYKTLGYIKYRLAVPKESRDAEQPKTPKKNQSCSKRSWDGQVKKWRRDLHLWDPTDPQECEPYFNDKLLASLFEGTLDVESIKKQLEEQVEELKQHGCLLLSPNDKHLMKKTPSGEQEPASGASSSSPSSRGLSISDAQPNRLFPSGVPDSDDSGDEACKVPDYLQKQPIARVLVFSAEC